MTFKEALWCAPAATLAVLASAASAEPVSSLTALNGLQPGLWELTGRGAAPRTICVANATAFLRLRHASSDCSNLVIANEPTRATVQYSCRGTGWGRTTVHASTPRSATIDSQGIAKGAPFAFVREARRIGPCDGRTAGLAR